MKTEHFYRASAIRLQARQGCSVADLAATFDEPESIIRQLLQPRTIEAAAKVLDERYGNNTPFVKRFLHSEGHLIDFTNLIELGANHK